MKILHVIPSLDPEDGGPSKAVVEIARALQTAGDEVEIVATGNPPDPPRDIRVRFFPRLGGLSYKYSPALGAWLADHAGDYDVLHLHSVFNHSTHAAAGVARRRRVPYILRTLGHLNRSYALRQGSFKKKLYLSLLGRSDLDRAAALHATSQGEKADIEALGLRPPVEVIPLGVYAPTVQPQFSSGNAILFLGRIHPKKGFDLLFPALGLLREKHAFRLIVAGPAEPEYLAALHAESEKHGLTSRITWHGMVTGTPKQALLSEAGIFVLPSYSENFGIAVVEAMAYGIPVIISDQVDLWPEVREYQAGLVTACRVEELAAARDSMLADPGLRARSSKNGRRLVAERFDWRVITARLQQLYKRVRGVA